PAISLEEVAEVEPIALRFVIGHEACSSREVKQAIVSAHGVVELANLSVRDLIAFGPHNPGHHLEQGEGTAQTPAGPVGEAAQNWRGEPGCECPSVKSPPLKMKTPRMSGPPAASPRFPRSSRRRKCSKTTSEEKSKATSVVDWTARSRQITSTRSVRSAVE